MKNKTLLTLSILAFVSFSCSKKCQTCTKSVYIVPNPPIVTEFENCSSYDLEGTFHQDTVRPILTQYSNCTNFN